MALPRCNTGDSGERRSDRCLFRLNSSNQGLRDERLLATLKLPTVPPDELQQLKDFLIDHHDVFSLEEGERGETGIVQLEIDTGDAPPQRQPPRRMPFVSSRR